MHYSLLSFVLQNAVRYRFLWILLNFWLPLLWFCRGRLISAMSSLEWNTFTNDCQVRLRGFIILTASYYKFLYHIVVNYDWIGIQSYDLSLLTRSTSLFKHNPLIINVWWVMYPCISNMKIIIANFSINQPRIFKVSTDRPGISIFRLGWADLSNCLLLVLHVNCL